MEVFDIFYKFLETQTVSTILAEVTGLIIAWTAWRKYKDAQKEQAFIKPLSKKIEVHLLLKELQNRFTERNN